MNQEIGRTASFEGKFAERTPSDWDKAFKAEMDEAMGVSDAGARDSLSAEPASAAAVGVAPLPAAAADTGN